MHFELLILQRYLASPLIQKSIHRVSKVTHPPVEHTYTHLCRTDALGFKFTLLHVIL